MSYIIDHSALLFTQSSHLGQSGVRKLGCVQRRSVTLAPNINVDRGSELRGSCNHGDPCTDPSLPLDVCGDSLAPVWVKLSPSKELKDATEV